MKIFLVFTTDPWHTRISRELIGAATTKGRAVEICKEKAAEEKAVIGVHDEQLLYSINQTQSYDGDSGEFVIEEVATDVLL